MRRVHWLHWLLALVLPLSAAAQLPVGIRTTNGTAMGITINAPVLGNAGLLTNQTFLITNAFPTTIVLTNTGGTRDGTYSIMTGTTNTLPLVWSNSVSKIITWGEKNTSTWTALGYGAWNVTTAVGGASFYASATKNYDANLPTNLWNYVDFDGTYAIPIPSGSFTVVYQVQTVSMDVLQGVNFQTTYVPTARAATALGPSPKTIATYWQSNGLPAAMLSWDSDGVGLFHGRFELVGFSGTTNATYYNLGSLDAADLTLDANSGGGDPRAVVFRPKMSAGNGQGGGYLAMQIRKPNTSVSADFWNPWAVDENGKTAFGNLPLALADAAPGYHPWAWLLADGGAGNAAVAFGVTNGPAYIATNIAPCTTITTDLVNGAINTGRNQRFSVVVSAYTNATLSAAFRVSLVYSNATTGFISTNMFGIPSGVLASFAETNQLVLPDCEPNSKFWLTNGWAVPNSTIITYK